MLLGWLVGSERPCEGPSAAVKKDMYQVMNGLDIQEEELGAKKTLGAAVISEESRLCRLHRHV